MLLTGDVNHDTNIGSSKWHWGQDYRPLCRPGSIRHFELQSLDRQGLRTDPFLFPTYKSLLISSDSLTVSFQGTCRSSQNFNICSVQISHFYLDPLTTILVHQTLERNVGELEAVLVKSDLCISRSCGTNTLTHAQNQC